MRKFFTPIAATVACLTLGVGVAQAMTAQQEAKYISTGFRQQLSARVRVLNNTYPGLRLSTTVVRCGSSGGNPNFAFYCTGTYVLTYKGSFAKYVAIIHAQRNGAWRVVGTPTEVSGSL